jgi:hypothetical protein
MKDMIYEDFQNVIGGLLLRHRSILDILTKMQDSAARVNRAIVKSVTSRGCIEIHGKKQEVPEGVSLDNIREYMDTHLTGELCEGCREAIEKEMGTHLFYLAGLGNTLDISLYDIIVNEEKRLAALGQYHLR